MTAITYRDGLSIFQLIVFVPCLCVAAYLWKRDGLGPGSAAWRFASTLSCLRLIGGIASLVAISHYTSTTGTIIIIGQVIGIPPLSLSCITLADRVNAHIKLIPNFIFGGLLLVGLAGLVLGIYGADNAISGSTDVGFSINNYIKAAMAIFLFLYASLVGLVVTFYSRWKQIRDPSDRRVILAMALATPFIGVRQIYAAIGDYGSVPAFGLLDGNTTLYLFMSVLMEMIAISIILGFGLTFGKAKKFEEITNNNEDGGREHVASDSVATLLVPLNAPGEIHRVIPKPSTDQITLESLQTLEPVQTLEHRVV